MKSPHSISLSVILLMSALASPLLMASNCLDKFEKNNPECVRANYNYDEFDAFFRDNNQIEQKIRVYLAKDGNTQELVASYFQFSISTDSASAPSPSQINQVLWDFRQAYLAEQLYRYSNTTCSQREHCPDPAAGDSKNDQNTNKPSTAKVIWLTRVQTTTRALDQSLSIAANGIAVANTLKQNGDTTGTEVQMLFYSRNDGIITDICIIADGGCWSTNPTIERFKNTETGKFGFSLSNKIDAKRKYSYLSALDKWFLQQNSYTCHQTMNCTTGENSVCTINLTCSYR